MELLYTSVVTERLTYKLLRWHKNATVCRKGRRIASEASVSIVGEIVTGSRMKGISKLLREPGNNWERRKEGVGVRWFYERLCYITIGGTKGNCFSPQSSSALGDEEKKRQRNPTQTPQNSPEGYVWECIPKEVYGSLRSEKPAYIPAAPRYYYRSNFTLPPLQTRQRQ